MAPEKRANGQIREMTQTWPSEPVPESGIEPARRAVARTRRHITLSETVNQMVFANVAGSQARELVEQLTRDGFYVTQIASKGGFLREATISLLIGLEKIRLPRFLEHIRKICQKRRQFYPAHAEAPFLNTPVVMIEAEIGGATVYVFDIERFEQL